MIVRLRTRCGCEKYLDISNKYPPNRINVPIISISDVSTWRKAEEVEIAKPRRRTFEFYGMHGENIPLYREVLE